VYFAPLPYVNDVVTIGKNDNMISVNTAMAVDLYGQISADCLAGKQQSAVGGQVDFVRGAQRSKGGKSFITVPSTVTKKDGSRLSRVLASFPPGTAVTTPRADVQYVVTEYGSVNLKTLTIADRAKALISLAHPDFRDELTEQAKAMRLF
jgi:4-hydroxybutyrate CoA-transferase